MTLAGGKSLTLAGEDSFFTTPPDGKAVLAPDKDDDGGLPRTRPKRLGLTLNVCIFLFFGLGFVEDGIAGSPSVETLDGGRQERGPTPIGIKERPIR